MVTIELQIKYITCLNPCCLIAYRCWTVGAQFGNRFDGKQRINGYRVSNPKWEVVDVINELRRQV